MPGRERFDRLDALRGAAMLWMAAFHFCVDLAMLGFIAPPAFLLDPFWLLQRIAIVSLFLGCAGIGQAIAHTRGQRPAQFWRRWLQVAAGAAAVSIGSYLMFPDSWISFGVLHGIALMLLILRPTRRWGAWLWPLGALAIVLPLVVQHPFFDSRVTDWVGLFTRDPHAQDHVPLLPWFGVMAWGAAIGEWLLARRRHWLIGALPAPLQPLAALGRWPLSFYLLHQPVMIGALMALRAA